MDKALDQVTKALDQFQRLAHADGYKRFFGQEVLRFHSIAQLLKAEQLGFCLDKRADADEKSITHCLARSLIENFFWLLYIFDVPGEIEDRYELLKNSFKRDYKKLMNEESLPDKQLLPPADHSWNRVATIDLRRLLLAINDCEAENMQWLYFVYRVTSFAAHGKDAAGLAEDVFGQPTTFPVLDIDKVIEIIAVEYLCVLSNHDWGLEN